MSRRCLDLCCCAGVGAWGYWRSGLFSEVVGVDIEDYSNVYPFDFLQADALTLTYDFLMDFDFIHASPPCQGYSKVTPDQSKHLRLIPDFHRMLYASGVPYVIENVEGSSRDLSPNLVMSGWDAGLSFTRRRYFHLSWISTRMHSQIRTRSAAKVSNRRGVNVSSSVTTNLSTAVDTHFNLHSGTHTKADILANVFAGLDDLPSKYLSRLTVAQIDQGIPPLMTLRIAQMLDYKKLLIA